MGRQNCTSSYNVIANLRRAGKKKGRQSLRLCHAFGRKGENVAVRSWRPHLWINQERIGERVHLVGVGIIQRVEAGVGLLGRVGVEGRDGKMRRIVKRVVV